ncbi:MAG TPA: hypothetical protein VKT30_15765 [Caulobacteraceae bacterium]|nr:hypothetical protein [Caulobacteraceae bacterium]
MLAGLLPPSTNGDYRGASASAWFLALAAVLTLGPALIHSFLPDGGATSIAGLKLGADRSVVIGVFRWEGATQLALGLAMLAVAVRYRTLAPLFLLLLIVEEGLSALQAWVLTPAGGHHPPEHYGALVATPLAVLFLALSLAPRRGPLGGGDVEVGRRVAGGGRAL